MTDDEVTLAANVAAWWQEQDRRIAAHAAIRAACKVCLGRPSAYGRDACRIAIAHVGVACYRTAG